ncbi:GntR family transcriptional regulator [Terriglobus saanensis]|uniref:Transcriptional regulator, GntR family n=1 Tax=Terriglobus saanensis (strain ATCC BAA-1853 / DSM 23119 / SP1PR4) TaxID=401053 RepID=E8V125_TERSS|nr:GntR family transcriptional regulator [Terriglobus saanensis]ADV83373.1 transcriptional regulator, GntR family [Terriglobus saanensis SP1PR4]
MHVEKVEADSLTEQAHRSIKRYILKGKLKHGDRVTEDFFAQELGISKAPVREALNALQNEGLLRIQPRKGAYLHHFTEKEVADLYDLREAIEVFAANTMVITPQLIEQLSESVERTCMLLKQNKKTKYIDEDIAFHKLIVEATGNRELQRVHANIQSKLWLCRCQTYQLTSPDTPAAHRELSDAIARKDREEAAEATRRHIRFVKLSLLERMRDPSRKSPLP